MRKSSLILSLVLVASCGQSVDTPEIVYEKGLDETGYLSCMTEFLLANDQCRLQKDEDIFEACFEKHHLFCIEQNEELKKGGVR